MRRYISLFFNHWFLPLVILLSLVGAVAALSQELGNLIQTAMTREGNEFVARMQVMKLASIVIFSCLIFLVGNIRFRKVFGYGLTFCFLLLFSSLFIFDKSNASYFITNMFCPSLLSLLGWAYINQMVSPSEGVKYYFFLNLIAGLVVTPFRLASTMLLKYGILDRSQSLLSPTYLFILFVLILVCFALIWICDRWVCAKFYQGDPQQRVATTCNKSWISIILLAVVLTSLKQVTLFNGLLIQTKTQAIAATTREYLSMMSRHAAMVGIGVFILVLLSLFIGPKLLRSRGWLFAILLTPMIAGFSILITLVSPNPFMLNAEQAILNGLESAWIFPLIQIALLSYTKKHRFPIQAWVFLVASPLLELGFRVLKTTLETAHIGLVGDILSSLIMLGLMAMSAFMLTRGDKALSRMNY